MDAKVQDVLRAMLDMLDWLTNRDPCVSDLDRSITARGLLMAAREAFVAAVKEQKCGLCGGSRRLRGRHEVGGPVEWMPCPHCSEPRDKAAVKEPDEPMGEKGEPNWLRVLANEGNVELDADTWHDMVEMLAAEAAAEAQDRPREDMN